MSDDRVSYRDLTKQFLQNIMQGEYDDSVRHDNLLVEAKKKEPDYGDGVYFDGGMAADVKARDDAWAGGDNVFSDIDHVKASGAPLDPRSEDRIMSITELRLMIDREMGMLSEQRALYTAPPVDAKDLLDRLRNVYGDEQVIYGLLSQYGDRGVDAMMMLDMDVSSRDPRDHRRDEFSGPELIGVEDLPTEQGLERDYGQELGGDMTKAEHMAALRGQWEEEVG